jgi:probable HAF family extracellular repeat protein
MKPILISIAINGLFVLAAAQPPRYTVVDLGTLQGGTFSQANSLNDNRLVGGNAAAADGTQQAVFWSGPFRINIGTPGLNSGIFGINASGQAAINGETTDKDPYNENFCGYGTGLQCHAFVWQRGVMSKLPTLGGYNSTIGNINARGEVIGATETAVRDSTCPTKTVAGTGPQLFDYEAVVWGPKAGDIRQLKPLSGDTIGMALWINDKGQAVGASGTCSNSSPPPLAFGPRAVIWDADGTPHAIPNLGSKVINIGISINNAGQVSGASSTTDQADPSNGVHAFLWSSEKGIQDLGTLPDDVGSVGGAINDGGDVVGPSFDSEGNPRGFLWRDGAMYDLNDLAVNSPLFLLWASGINARGEIAGFGVTEKGDVHAYLAIPAPGRNADSLAPLSRAGKVNLSNAARELIRQRVPYGTLLRPVEDR